MSRDQEDPRGEPESTTLLTLLPVFLAHAFVGFFVFAEQTCRKGEINGIQAEYHEYKGALHAFIHYSKVMDDAEDALRRGAHFFAHNCGLDPRN